MRTGEVARQTGVNIQTLRYYERRGLLPEPPRRDSGYRLYDQRAVNVVQFIKRAQSVGFSLNEVEALLELAAGGPENCDAALEVARQRIAELDRRIADLRAMRASLRSLMATCERPREERDCPLIHSLAVSGGNGEASKC